jgi:thiamine kinase-like enzyme
MPQRQEHQEDIRRYLREHFQNSDWSFSLPRGSGMETYFAEGNGQRYFIKVGAPIARYLAMAELELTPPVIAYGQLESDVSIIVQPLIEGGRLSKRDFHDRLETVATVVQKMHHAVRIKETLDASSSNHFIDAGLQAFTRLRSRWEKYKERVPRDADFVDNSLEHLARQITLLRGDGLIASHNDICNANWLFASDGKIYIVDLESMSMDDPAADMGALLWWYYPPELRQKFLNIAGYLYNDEFRVRMWVRMAMHCLSIILPRDSSFDRFNPEGFSDSLQDFRAVLEGKENPQGYVR